MPRTTPTDAAFVQCRESFVAVVDGEEKVARVGAIYRADHPTVRHWPELFAELGGLPDAPQYVPEHARIQA